MKQTKKKKTKYVDVVVLKLDTISGDISALVVLQITTPVKNYIVLTVMKHPYLRTLPLANQTKIGVFEINLLIGADYYWMIVENNVVRGPGPTAVASKLGYLLSGPTNLKNTSALNTMVM